jgi:hypothetical protein
MNWLNNGWVIGIATGVVSGLLVYWLLSLFLSKKKDREYQQLVRTANREVIYAIRAGIPDNALPPRVVVEALIRSTARRYDLGAADLYQPEELTEELIKEVMDSSFLSATKKAEYCTALQTAMIKTETPRAELRVEAVAESIRRVDRVQSKVEIVRLSAFVSSLVGIFSAFLALRELLPTLQAKLHAVGRSVFVSIGTALFATIVIYMMSLFISWLPSRHHYSVRLKPSPEIDRKDEDS